MSIDVDKIVKRAIREGVLDNLEGRGQPLAPDPFASLPKEIRDTYRILKQSGCTPPEVERMKEINALKSKLERKEMDREASDEIRKKIMFKEVEVKMAMERISRYR